MNISFSFYFCIIIVLVPTVTKFLLFKFHFNVYAYISFQVDDVFILFFRFCVIIVLVTCFIGVLNALKFLRPLLSAFLFIFFFFRLTRLPF